VAGVAVGTLVVSVAADLVFAVMDIPIMLVPMVTLAGVGDTRLLDHAECGCVDTVIRRITERRRARMS
jgi:hypothetical protein